MPRWLVVFVIAVFAVAGLPVAGASAAVAGPALPAPSAPTGLAAAVAAGAPNAGPAANDIQIENARTGNPESEWEVTGSGDPAIQGYTTDISADHGGTVSFKVDVDPVVTAFHIDIYRLGWYGGDGARRVATIDSAHTTPTQQPPCYDDVVTTGLVDCGNWSVSATWAVPADAVSGIYIGRLVRDDSTGGASHVPFVIRNDESHSKVLFQTSDSTWQAYNTYGGNSLYKGTGHGTGGQADGRAYKVSYNRPITVRADTPEDSLFNAEYPALRWFERNGYDLSYTSGLDVARSGSELLEHKVFMSVGHDEYWSGPQRANVEAARDAGVNLAFLSGNEVFWKTRWEPSFDGTSTPNRTLVSYKETHNYPNNPDPTSTWTGTWRDPRDADSVDDPENSLTGTLFTVNCCTYDMVVPDQAGATRLWRNSSVAASPGPDTLASGILGYEWDEDVDNGSRPANEIRMSRSTHAVLDKLDAASYGSTYSPGTATHSLTLYKAASGALVFGAGTVQWAWGLDDDHDRGDDPAIPAVQQATMNLLSDMGVSPGSPQPELVVSGPSTDTVAPTVTVTAPTAGSVVPAGTVTVQGTAADVGGGAVGAVEVSTDGGATWHPAEGWTTWSYSFPSGAQGTSWTVRVRAVDDSFNVGAASSVAFTVGAQVCPCSIFSSDIPPATGGNDGVSGGISVGVKFRADVTGSVSAVRFYKATAGSVTVTGHLYSVAGTVLGLDRADRRGRHRLDGAAPAPTGGHQLGHHLRCRVRLAVGRLRLHGRGPGRRDRQPTAARAGRRSQRARRRLPLRRGLPVGQLRELELLGGRRVHAGGDPRHDPARDHRPDAATLGHPGRDRRAGVDHLQRAARPRHRQLEHDLAVRQLERPGHGLGRAEHRPPHRGDHAGRRARDAGRLPGHGHRRPQRGEGRRRQPVRLRHDMDVPDDRPATDRGAGRPDPRDHRSR